MKNKGLYYTYPWAVPGVRIVKPEGFLLAMVDCVTRKAQAIFVPADTPDKRNRQSQAAGSCCSCFILYILPPFAPLSLYFFAQYFAGVPTAGIDAFIN